MVQGTDVTICPAIVDFDDESVLLTAAQNGDVTCFGTLLSREEKIFRIAKNNDAEEVTQKAFWKSLRCLEDLRGDSRFNTWPVRITSAHDHQLHRSAAPLRLLR